MVARIRELIFLRRWLTLLNKLGDGTRKYLEILVIGSENYWLE